MPWGRVDDTYYDHPKLELLEAEGVWPDRLAAAGLNSIAWSWCNRFLTDGRIPRTAVGKLGGTIELADKLVQVGLWESVPGGYQIHDFLTYNDSAEDVRKRRDADAKRKAEWRARHRDGDDESIPGHSVTAASGRSHNGTGRSRKHDVTPSVTAGHDVTPGQPVTAGPEDVPVGLAHAGPRARATRDVARIPSRPVPSHTEKVPLAESEPRANGAGPTLSKAELEAWRSFGPEWDDVKAAWIGRGLRLPPMGAADDDAGQRGLLYPILDARPRSLVEWIAEAKGRTAHQVIAHVLERWHEVRAEAGLDEPPGSAGDPDKVEAMSSLGEILARLPG